MTSTRRRCVVDVVDGVAPPPEPPAPAGVAGCVGRPRSTSAPARSVDLALVRQRELSREGVLRSAARRGARGSRAGPGCSASTAGGVGGLGLGDRRAIGRGGAGSASAAQQDAGPRRSRPGARRDQREQLRSRRSRIEVLSELGAFMASSSLRGRGVGGGRLGGRRTGAASVAGAGPVGDGAAGDALVGRGQVGGDREVGQRRDRRVGAAGILVVGPAARGRSCRS